MFLVDRLRKENGYIDQWHIGEQGFSHILMFGLARDAGFIRLLL